MAIDKSTNWIPQSGLDVLLLLLYVPEKGELMKPVEGITKLDKLMFLLSKTVEFSSLFESDYEFIPYNFGPFATELLDDLEALVAEGIINREKSAKSFDATATRDAETIEEETGELPDNEISWDMYSFDIYSLTQSGEHIARLLFEACDEKQKRRITVIKERFNPMPLTSLLRFVYVNYPAYATASEIREELLSK